MKVIDLLNKIANNEEVPKKIKFRDLMLEWDYEYRDYKFINTGNHFLHSGIAPTILNVKIEIIEEKPKKIEKLNLDTDKLLKNVNITVQDYVIEGKINEIIDYLLEKESDK